MKTLLIVSAFLLVFSSCTKECPVPDPEPPAGNLLPDPDPVPPPDPGDDDPPPCCYNNHPGSTISWMTTTSFNSVG